MVLNAAVERFACPGIRSLTLFRARRFMPKDSRSITLGAGIAWNLSRRWRMISASCCVVCERRLAAPGLTSRGLLNNMTVDNFIQTNLESFPTRQDIHSALSSI
jgi:hypothetical protein